LTFAISGIASALLFLGPLHPLETSLLDTHFRVRNVRFEDPPILIVAVDTTSLETLGDLPWSPETTARLLDILALSGANVIGSTVPFSHDAVKALSPQTISALKRSLVLADAIVRDPYDRNKNVRVPVSNVWKSIAAGTGIADIETLDDGVSRLQPLVYDTDSGRFPSFDLQIVQVSEGLPTDDWSTTASRVQMGNRSVPTDRRHRLYVNYVGKARTFPFIPAYKVLNGEIYPSLFRGKIVLIGAASPRLGRDVPTPTALNVRMPEIEVHANAIHTVITRRFVRPMPSWLSVIATALVTVGVGIVFRHQGSRRSVFILSSVLGVTMVMAHLFFVWFGFWLYVLSFVLSLPFSYVFTVMLELSHLSRTTEAAIVRMATVSNESGFQGRVAMSATEFWSTIARSVSQFLTVDSMVFLEKAPHSASLHVAIVYPESAKATIKIEHHSIHSEPYSRACEAPVLVQHYVKNEDSDSWVVPLLSGRDVIGFWVLNLLHGRQYFERNEDTIRYFGRQIELELIKRQIIVESEASENNILRRFVELYRRHVRADEMISLTESIVEERIRFVAAINSLADGLFLYDLFGRLILYNEAGYQIARSIVDDIATSPLHEVVYRFLEASDSVKNPDETRAEIIQQIERIIRAKEGAVYLLTIGDVPKRYYQCMLTAIEDTTNPALSQTIGVACVLNDISMFSNVADYSGLLQTVSQRGRNLMTPIIGLVPLLASSEDLTPTQRYALEVIRRNAEEIAALFDEFRDAPSMDITQDGTAEIPSELNARLPVDVAEVIQEILADTKHRGNGRVRVTKEVGLIERVWGNRLLIRGALESLITLLDAFLPPDGWLNVSVEWDETRHVRITTEASSHVGMPPQARAYLIEQLALPASTYGSYETKTVETRELTHLALPQIRHIVEVLHNGTLECRMDDGDMLAFVISIPTVV
jgi:CHASE2 domain-containing sensor protein/signal transduction histidine kinase